MNYHGRCGFFVVEFSRRRLNRCNPYNRHFRKVGWSDRGVEMACFFESNSAGYVPSNRAALSSNRSIANGLRM